MQLMLFVSTILWLIATTIDNVNGYQELTRIEVCSITFTEGDGSLDALFSDRSYSLDGVAYWKDDDGLDTTSFFWDSQNENYRFVYPNHATHGDIIVKLNGQNNQRTLFSNLETNSGACSCPSSSSPGTNTVTSLWRLEGLNQFGRPSVTLCGEWTDYGTDMTSGFDPNTDAADLWDCDYAPCDTLSDASILEYQGFEVFTDDHCSTPDRRNTGEWRCNENGCITDYHVFSVVGTNQKRHKCLHCQTLFGDSCDFCQRDTGCQQCTQTAAQAGYGIIPSGDCEWQYCALECCEEDDDPTPDPTPMPTDSVCVESGPVGGGQGSTDYLCYDHAERAALSPYYGGLVPDGTATVPNTPDGRYTLPLPISPEFGTDCNPLSSLCYGDCENGVPYRCPGVDDNCELCNPDQPFHLRGCDICKCSDEDPRSNSSHPEHSECSAPEDEYFWYSNAVPCAPCSAIQDCEKCRNGGDHGGGGCDQCALGFSARYDDVIGIWFCTANPSEGLETTPLPGDDGWPGLQCLEECSSRRGQFDYCNCGCDCNTCTQSGQPFPPADNPVNPYCIDCEYHSGCGQCHNNNEDVNNDFFMLSPYHKCENCSAIFGTRCMYCNDFIGCAQCRPGYLHTYSDCCEMWYCEAASQFY